MSDLSFSDSELDWISDGEEQEDPTSPIGRVYKIEDIWKMQSEMATEVSEALVIPVNLAFYFLHMHKWYKQEVLNSYMVDPERFKTKFNTGCIKKRKVTSCPLCTESGPGLDLGCGHGICEGCFDEYMNYKIGDGDIYTAICPGDSACRRIIPPLEVNHFPNYRETSAQIFLRFQNIIKGCPSPNCKYFHELLGYNIVCECGSALCGHCGFYLHEPSSCELVDKWLCVLEDDKDTLLKVMGNTKTCPKCRVIIEKQIGCNHITCACGYEFCWQCQGEWINYGHQCSRYQETTKKNSNHKRLAHYAPRYSTNLAASQYYSVEDDNATLRNARSLIAWTYVLLFYMNDSNQRTLLENNLVNLEQASERLIESLRQGQFKDEQNRLNSYVIERTGTLKEYTTSMKWKEQ